MISLNNIATDNAYTPGNTLAQAGTVRVNLAVSNAAIFWKFRPTRNSQFNPEEFLLPGLYSFDLMADEVAVRSGAVGVPARVTVTLKTNYDLGQA